MDISKQFDLLKRTVRRWKSTKWDNERSNRNKGAQPGNKNASSHGAPKKNSNAEKHGLFWKYLPEETFSIIEEMPTDPLDVLWDQIQMSPYADEHHKKMKKQEPAHALAEGDADSIQKRVQACICRIRSKHTISGCGKSGTHDKQAASILATIEGS